MVKKLPLFELLIDEENGSIVNAVGLVESPAIESEFIAFNKQEHFVKNEERKELLGIAMIPEQKIFRVNEKSGLEYEVFFSSDTIRKIAQQYFNYGFQNNLNLHHSTIPAKSFIYQSFIVDSKKGINSPTGLNAPDGSWVIGVKVNDDEVWNKIKSGEVKGFSIEGVFDFLETRFSSEDEEVLELLNQINGLIETKGSRHTLTNKK